MYVPNTLTINVKHKQHWYIAPPPPKKNNKKTTRKQQPYSPHLNLLPAKLFFEAVDYITIYTRTFCTYRNEEGVGKWVKNATQNRGNVYGDVRGRDDWDGHDVGVKWEGHPR